MTDFIFGVEFKDNRLPESGTMLDWWEVSGHGESDARNALEIRARQEGRTLISATLADTRDSNGIPSRLMRIAAQMSLEFGVTVEGPYGDGSPEGGAQVKLEWPHGRGVSLAVGGSLGYDGPAGIEMIRTRRKNGERRFSGHPVRDVGMDEVRAALQGMHLPE